MIRIPIPREPIIDPRTGLISRTWYLAFSKLFEVTASSTTSVSLADIEVLTYAYPDYDAYLTEATKREYSLQKDDISEIMKELDALKSSFNSSLADLTNRLDEAIANEQPLALGTMAEQNANNVNINGGNITANMGTYAAGVVVQAGYITVNDLGGTPRRLLIG